jgi:hypothetical protein
VASQGAMQTILKRLQAVTAKVMKSGESRFTPGTGLCSKKTAGSRRIRTHL